LTKKAPIKLSSLFEFDVKTWEGKQTCKKKKKKKLRDDGRRVI
jgi:hypothetical protein